MENKNGVTVNDPLLIDFGNFNYGVFMSAAGFNIKLAFLAAAHYNTTGSGSKTGYDGSNPTNDFFIMSGYNAYLLGQL